jgi:hypothetical protein
MTPRTVTAAALGVVVGAVAVTLARLPRTRRVDQVQPPADLPYPGFDESGALLLSWVPDGLPDDLIDWFLGVDGSGL